MGEENGEEHREADNLRVCGRRAGLAASHADLLWKSNRRPLLKPVFKDFTNEHVRRVALWLGEVFGGPSDYSDTRGGHLTILGAHAGRHITKAQRDRWVELMFETAREVLPASEIFQERFRSYIEFGADIAVRASQLDEPPKSAGAVPKWDWEPGIIPDSR